MATREDLEINLEPPPAARPSAAAIIELVEEGIQAQVLLVATGYEDTTYDVDPVAWLTNQGMLSAEGLDAPSGESVMVDRYGGRRGDIESHTDDLQSRNDSVGKSAIAAFSTGDGTFQDIKSKVTTLQENLAQAPPAEEGKPYMPIGAEYAVVNDALNTLWDVVELVNVAQRDMERYAEEVERANPGNNGNPAAVWGDRSPESNMTFTVTGDATRAGILEAARAELWHSGPPSAEVPMTCTTPINPVRKSRTISTPRGAPHSPATSGRRRATRSTGRTRTMYRPSGTTPKPNSIPALPMTRWRVI